MEISNQIRIQFQINKIRMSVPPQQQLLATTQALGTTALGAAGFSASTVADSIPTTAIDFGYCSIQQTATRSFTLMNPYTQPGQLVKFDIHIENIPFVLSCSSGTLAPRQKQEITITFTPEEAKVVIATAVFKFSGAEEGSKVLKISAIGKYPFVTINHEKFDFESLLVGKQAQKDVILKNNSLVSADFNVERVNDDGKDIAFSIDNYHGIIPPGSSFKIIVKFIPSVVGQTSCTQYRVKVVGGNDLNFSCVGQADGFNVSLNVKSIHFGEVQIGNNTNRLLNICNDSELPTTFQFFTDDKNVFSFSKIEGTVNAKSQTRIIITFTPQATTNYYERVFCVVRNHSVLYVDLIGTCYDILTKPLPLMQRHVDIYRHKVIMGIHNKSRGKQMLTDGTMGSDDKALMGSLEEDLELMHEIAIDDPNQVVLHKEMFLEQSSESRDLKLREEFIDFGFTEYGRVSEGKPLTFDNKFPFEVSVSWVLLKVVNPTTGAAIDNPFKVSPSQTIVPANTSFQFNVKFAPHVPDSYFFQIAQCFVQIVNSGNSKTKRLNLGSTGMQSVASKSVGKTLLGSIKKNKFEEALHEELDPPTVLSLRLVAHSFPPGSQPFIPMVKIAPSNKIVFPHTGVNESVYQTVQIVNTSDTPVYFKILQDSTKTFRAFPPLGLIPGKSFGLLCFEFSPKQARFYNFTAQCVFNHSASNIQNLHLVGYCYQPSLTIGNDSKLFFPPTYTGVSSKQRLSIKNEARIPVQYEWKVPDKYKTEVYFEPQKSLLLPNEETKVTCTFTPLKKKEYLLSVPIYISSLYDHMRDLVGFYNPGSGLLKQGNSKSARSLALTAATKDNIVRYEVEVIGAGSDGVLSLSPKDIDFGTITVGFAKTMSVTVINKSNCNLFIELKMAQKVEEDGTISKETEAVPLMKKVLQECFKFDQPKGLLNAKSKKKVNITFKPNLRFNFDINLVCVAREKLAKEVPTMGKSLKENIVEKSFIKIRAMGDYPLLRVTDVRNEQISTANLWERFRLSTMNKELVKPLNECEQIFNNSEKTNQSIHDLQKNLKSFTWDFGKIPIKYGSKPRKVVLSLKNIGGVDAEWQFKMPNDNEIALEPWADPGEPTEEQAFERHILEKNIFQIEPRRGNLKPGEQMDVSVYYYPKEVKLHYLRVFFHILNGKPLIINLQGETLHRRAQLQLLKHTYSLPPVPIGVEWAVTYPIEIKNLGITKLKYQIDTTLLQKLNRDNYDFHIFEIQNPEGTLLANETQFIYTLFRPLEAKEYALDLPIKVSDIEGPSPDPQVLRLRGFGYHFEDKRPQELPFYEDLPKCRSNLSDQGAMAAFSLEEIDFGELEHDELSRRFVILYNLHPTQRLKFDFLKSGLMCGDNIKLEPMSGELKPNSHQNIKMTLISSRYPTHFEGEIACQIEWESGDGDATNKHHNDAKSVVTTTVANDIGEYLFIRLRKRSKLTKTPLALENRETEALVDNFVLETMHEILESEDLDQALTQSEQRPPCLFSAYINDQQPPCFDTLQQNEALDDLPEEPALRNQNTQKFEEELKTLSGVEDDGELFRKRMFLEERFVGMLEYMLEDTLFNLMEEATYEEFDLTQAPKIYIRKQ